MRSPLQPLPQPGSPRALIAVFALVVLGIGVTVAEYVRSTAPTAHAAPTRSTPERAEPRADSRPTDPALPRRAGISTAPLPRRGPDPAATVTPVEPLPAAAPTAFDPAASERGS